MYEVHEYELLSSRVLMFDMSRAPAVVVVVVFHPAVVVGGSNLSLYEREHEVFTGPTRNPKSSKKIYSVLVKCRLRRRVRGVEERES